MVDKVQSDPVFDLSDLVIRQVTKADLPALEWDGKYQKYRRMFANLYHNTRSGRALMWVVETQQGEIVGQAFVMLKSSEHDAADGVNRAYVFAFRVKRAWRNRGIGAFLMGHVEEDLHQRGFNYVTLNVAKENPDAKRLYKRLGYKVIGSQPGIWSFKDHQGKIHHVNEPAWRMMKRLAAD